MKEGRYQSLSPAELIVAHVDIVDPGSFLAAKYDRDLEPADEASSPVSQDAAENPTSDELLKYASALMTSGLIPVEEMAFVSALNEKKSKKAARKNKKAKSAATVEEVFEKTRKPTKSKAQQKAETIQRNQARRQKYQNQWLGVA